MYRIYPVFVAVAALISLPGSAPAQTILHQTVPRNPGLLERFPDLSQTRPAELFPTGLREVWMLALAHDESEMRQLAARSIVIANQGGLKDWAPVEPLLIKNLDDPRRAVRLATAEALAELNMQKAARKLAEVADKDGLEMSLIVEPALARWNDGPRVETWLRWLDEPGQNQGLAKLAMLAFAKIENKEANSKLASIVKGDSQASIRVAAARTLSQSASDGMEEIAAELAQQPGVGPKAIPRVLAATILRSHDSPQSLEILRALLDDKQPSVISSAAEGLLNREPERIVERGHHILVHGDANARRLFVEALFMRPNAVRIEMLADRLGDVNPTVRVASRERMLELSERAEFHEVVVQQNRRMLATNSWQACEQASLLAAGLKDVGAVSLLVELLEHPRPEAYVSSAWTLAELNQQEGLKKASEICAERFDHLVKNGYTGDDQLGFDDQCAHLMQWFGAAKYEPADALLRECIPKSVGLNVIRRGAIWGLGKMHEGNTVPELVKRLTERLEDVNSPDPEDNLVRHQCAITLGRMKSVGSTPVLRKWLEMDGVANLVGSACAWSINRITGEPIPQVSPEPGYRSGFFLERVTKPKE